MCLSGKKKGQNTCYPGMDGFGNSIFRLKIGDGGQRVFRSDQDATEKMMLNSLNLNYLCADYRHRHVNKSGPRNIPVK